MKLKGILSASCMAMMLAAGTAAPAAAAPINLEFSFGTVLGGVSGTFYGLNNADGTYSATRFFLDGSYDTYDVFLSAATSNSFTFSNGTLTAVDFAYENRPNGAPGVGSNTNVLFSLNLDLTDGVTDEYNIQFDSFGFQQGAPTFKQVAISAVPLPAGALLMLSGLAGLAFANRRRPYAG